jgi:hypothetical protein
MTKIPTPEVVARVRRGYAEGVPVSEIAAQVGITSMHVLYGCFDGRYPDGSSEAPAAIPRRMTKTSVRRGGDLSRAALVARIWRTARKQVEDIEQRLAAAGLPLAERESNNRMLAVVARTLRELNSVDAGLKQRTDTPKSDDDGPPPRNVDELRAALAQKLEAFIRREGDSVSDDAG